MIFGDIFKTFFSPNPGIGDVPFGIALGGVFTKWCTQEISEMRAF